MSLDNPFRDKPVARHDLPEVVGRLYRERGRRILERIGDSEPVEHHPSSSLEGEILSTDEEKKEWETQHFEESCFNRPAKTVERMVEFDESDADMRSARTMRTISKNGRCVMALCTLISARRTCGLSVNHLINQLSSTFDVSEEAMGDGRVYTALATCCDDEMMRAIDKMIAESSPIHSDIYRSIGPTIRLSRMRRDDPEREALEDDLEYRFSNSLNQFHEGNTVHTSFERYLKCITDQPERVHRILRSWLLELNNDGKSTLLSEEKVRYVGMSCARFGLIAEAKNAWKLMQHKVTDPSNDTLTRFLFALSRASASSFPEEAKTYFQAGLVHFKAHADVSIDIVDAIDLALLFERPLETLRTIEHMMIKCGVVPDGYARFIKTYTQIGAKEDALRCHKKMTQKLAPTSSPQKGDHELPATIEWFIAHAGILKAEGKDPRPFLQQFSIHVIDRINAHTSAVAENFSHSIFEKWMKLAQIMINHDADPTSLLEATKAYLIGPARDQRSWSGRTFQHLCMIVEHETAWAVKQIMTSRTHTSH